jgi:hypothetical protein
LTMFSRTLFAALLLAVSAHAAPPLTTIQDVLYKADGTRFNGVVMISWSSFEAPDRSAIATQMTTVKVVDGNLRVQLVPNTASSPLVYYSVIYNSDGRVQFSELWAVPSSAQSLRIRDVRIPAPIGNDVVGGAPVQEADVVGLIADLGARPLKGPAFAAGRVAMVNPLGSLDGVAGSPGDCVRVDGSSGPCGPPASFMDGDIPSGIVDGANTSFSLSATPNPAASLSVYRNGLLMALGADYSLTNRVIQFVPSDVPDPGDTLLATYRLSGAGTASQLFPSPQVLCSATGAGTSGASFISLGTCTIPGGTLVSGDRVELQFNLTHQGVVSAFTFEVHWGATTILHRDGTVNDTQVTGRADAGLYVGGAQVSTQSWGTTLPLSATISSATDAYSGALVVDFQGKLGVAGDTLTLRNFTVVRLP